METADSDPHPGTHEPGDRDRHHDPKDEPANYFLRVFYHNPRDPDLLVPMRFGSGSDFNYARWPGRAMVLLIGAGLAYALVTVLA